MGDYVGNYSKFLLNYTQFTVWEIIEDYVNNHNYLTNLNSIIQDHPTLHTRGGHNLLALTRTRSRPHIEVSIQSGAPLGAANFYSVYRLRRALVPTELYYLGL